MDLEICVFLHVVALCVQFGRLLLELIFEAINDVISVLMETKAAQKQAWSLRSAHRFVISPLPDKVRRDKAIGFTLSLNVAPFQGAFQRLVWSITHIDGNKPTSKEWLPLERVEWGRQWDKKAGLLLSGPEMYSVMVRINMKKSQIILTT